MNKLLEEQGLEHAGADILKTYAAHKNVKSLATTILNDVEVSGEGRKYLVRTIIPACHPHKLKDANIGEKATAKTVTQIANTLLNYFSDRKLWHRPDEWDRHVDHLIHNGEIAT